MSTYRNASYFELRINDICMRSTRSSCCLVRGGGYPNQTKIPVLYAICICIVSYILCIHNHYSVHQTIEQVGLSSLELVVGQPVVSQSICCGQPMSKWSASP